MWKNRNELSTLIRQIEWPSEYVRGASWSKANVKVLTRHSQQVAPETIRQVPLKTHLLIVLPSDYILFSGEKKTIVF